MINYNIFDNKIADLLNIKLYDSWFFQVDYWSGVHFLSGYLLAKIIPSALITLVLLIIYEVFEFLLWGSVFRKEPLRNIFSDIVIGMMGYYAGRII